MILGPSRAEADIVVRGDDLDFATPTGTPGTGSMEFYIETDDGNPVEVGDYQIRVRLTGPNPGTDVKITGGGATDAGGDHPPAAVSPRLATEAAQVIGDSEYFIFSFSVLEGPGGEIILEPPLMIDDGAGVARVDFEVAAGVEDDYSFQIVTSAPPTTDTEFLAGDFATPIPLTLVHPLLSISPAYFLSADFNLDGFVGADDLSLLITQWNTNPTIPPADFIADANGDGFVGADDLSALILEWNLGIPPAGALGLSAEAVVVPEPAALAVVMAGGFGLVLQRRRAA